MNVGKQMKDSLDKEFMNLTGKGQNTSDILNQLSKTKQNMIENKKKKKENKEATGAGAAAGAYSAPLFTKEKKQVEEKWSQKYKDSIDCNNPKGFSQKAHCQGKKKKVETKEATGASSSGQYSTPAAWAKTLNKKDWRGASKTQIPGGKFVTVKEKCKKFPYCNQGDIKALNIYENELVKKVINNIVQKYQIDENVIKSVIQYEIELRKLRNK